MANVSFDREIKVEVFSKTGDVLVFEDLHKSFNVVLRSRGNPNEATIRIFNMSPTSRNFLRGDGVAVRLFAGYKGNMGKIFEGTIITPVTNPDDSVNMVTEIYSGDGYRELNRSYFSKSYVAGTPVEVIVRDVAGALGLPAEIDPAPLAGKTILRGRSFDGKTKRVLNRLAKDYNLDWKINFGVLNIGVEDEVDRKNPTAVVLNSSTGLIGTPTVKFERFRGETRRRVVARSLLNRRLRPGSLVDITSKRFVIEADKKFKNNRSEISPDGVYLIDETTFTGNDFSGYFDAKVTGYGNR